MGELLTQSQLKKLMHYDSSSGIFTWLERPIGMFNNCKYSEDYCNSWNTKYANKEAGCILTQKEGKTSYLRVGITLKGKTKLYQAHRLAILYSDGHWPAKQVDHIDGDGTNNRRINLREVSALENHKNKSMPSTNTSGHVGVTWSKATEKWKVQIGVNGKNIYGGLFINKEDAIAKRKQMEIEYSFHKNHGRE